MSSIWYYATANDDESEDLALVSECIYCKSRLKRDYLAEREVRFQDDLGLWDDKRPDAIPVIGICLVCGWWKYGVKRLWPTKKGEPEIKEVEIRYGLLKELSLSDITLPIEEVRRYLMANYESRFGVHPRLFEEVVASVFKDEGYDTLVTAYSGDGGIDVIMSNSSNEQIGVQVKRYKNSISVEQIRAFTGALVIRGLTKGIFVTTSNYQSGAESAAQVSGMRGYPIELIDADKFYEKLEFVQISSYSKTELPKPWMDVEFLWGRNYQPSRQSRRNRNVEHRVKHRK